jgi:hypothetical protein
MHEVFPERPQQEAKEVRAVWGLGPLPSKAPQSDDYGSFQDIQYPENSEENQWNRTVCL